MGHGKAPFHFSKSKSYYCPFGKSCVFLVDCYYWCYDCKSIVHYWWGINEISNAFIGPDARAKAAFVGYEAKGCLTVSYAGNTESSMIKMPMETEDIQ